MSDGRMRQSGAQYKRKRAEKQFKEEEILKKTLRLDERYFISKRSK